MTKLYPYQKRGVKRIIRFKGRVLLADEMGLGKTIQALVYVKRTPRVCPVLVICPASAKWVWADEARRHLKMKSLILSGTKPKLPADLPPIVIINYDILSRKNKNKETVGWLETLLSIKFRTLIIDECHFIKNTRAIRTKAVHKLGRKAKHVLALSGTPLTNRPAELFSVLKLLHPKVYTSFRKFAWKYCNPKWTPWGWDYSGSKNLKELHQELKDLCMIRRRKSQVLKELPDKNRMVIPVEIERKSEYQLAENDFFKWLMTKTNVKKIPMAEKLVQLGCLKRLAAELKMRMVFDWIDTFLEETDEKLVIFAYHKKIIKTLVNKYKKISVIVDGSVSMDKRKKAIKTFQKKRKVRLFIGNIIAAGTAITLTAAHSAVFVELDFVPGNHIQAEDRIHRIGQKEKVFVYYLVAKGTIEEKLCKIIQKKAEIIASVLDGKTKQDRLDVFDRLLKSYEREVST